jgi:hypothetical protein
VLFIRPVCHNRVILQQYWVKCAKKCLLEGSSALFVVRVIGYIWPFCIDKNGLVEKLARLLQLVLP